MIRINLLPHKRVKSVEKSVLKLRMAAVAASVLVALGLAGFFFSLHSKKSDLADKKEETAQKLAALKKTVQEVQGYEKTRKELEEKVKLIQSLEKRRVPMTLLVNELNSQNTKEVWFTSLQAKGAAFTLDGMARDSKANVKAFVDRLGATYAFQEVKLEDVKEDAPYKGTKRFAFKVSGKLTGFAAPQQQAAPAPPAPAKKK